MLQQTASTRIRLIEPERNMKIDGRGKSILRGRRVANISFFVILTLQVAIAAASSFGTGFFVSRNGHVATNAHVIEGASKIVVYTNESQYEASVLVVDESNDLAILKVDAATKPLHVRTVDGINKGSRVFTIGFPNPSLQGVEPKYTDGAISSFSGLRDKPNVMQISTPIQPGNSGGPLIDQEGNVVGVVVSKLNAIAVMAKQEYIPENVNFAIKGDYLLPLLNAIPQSIRQIKSKNYKINEIESSVVLISAITTKPNSEKVATADPPSPPPAPSPNVGQLIQPIKPGVPTRRVNVFAPDAIENGCVVPIGFSVMPSLGAGDTAVIKLDGIPVTTVGVNSGTIREFQYRIRISKLSSVTIECAGCSGESFAFKSLKMACAEDKTHTSIGEVKVKSEGGVFRALIAGNYPATDFYIEGGGSSYRVSTSPSTAQNPFIMIKSDSNFSGRECLRVSSPFGSKTACN